MSVEPPDDKSPTPLSHPPARFPGWPEVIVGASVAVTFLFVAWVCLFAPFSSAMRRVQMTVTASDMKQLHLAAWQMAVDGTTNAALGLPGDTGGSFSHWAAQLVQENYLSTNDLAMLLSTPDGHFASYGRIPTANTNGVLVYAISTNFPGNAVFLSTWNFVNSPSGGAVSSKPSARWAWNGFAIMHKDGSGAILAQSDAGQTNIIGSYVPLCQ